MEPRVLGTHNAVRLAAPEERRKKAEKKKKKGKKKRRKKKAWKSKTPSQWTSHNHDRRACCAPYHLCPIERGLGGHMGRTKGTTTSATTRWRGCTDLYREKKSTDPWVEIRFFSLARFRKAW
jgi:hypothetical protein